MSSVSRSSRISAKSQVIIEAQDKLLAEQGGQITGMAKEMAMMKKMLEDAGIKPLVEDMDLDESRQAKKRHLSNSPTGKNWEGSDSSLTSDEISEEDMQLSYLKRNATNATNDKKKKSKLSKRARKRARNLHASLEKKKQNARGDDKMEKMEEKEKEKETEAEVESEKSKSAVIPTAALTATNKAAPTETGLYSTMAARRPGSGSGSGPIMNEEAGDPNDSGNGNMGSILVIPPIFKTPRSEGPFKDEIVVEILSIDGRDFAGTITPTEARRKIYEEQFKLIMLFCKM